MPTAKTIIKSFGGENRPVIRRSSRRKLNSKKTTSSTKVDREDKENYFVNDYDNANDEQRKNKQNGTKRKRGKSSHRRMPLSDTTNDISNHPSLTTNDDVDKKSKVSSLKSPTVMVPNDTLKNHTKKQKRIKEASLTSSLSPTLNDQKTPKINNRKKRGIKEEIPASTFSTTSEDNESNDSAMDCSSDESSVRLLNGISSSNMKPTQNSHDFLSTSDTVVKAKPTIDEDSKTPNIASSHQWIDQKGDPHITKGMMKRLLNEGVDNKSVMNKLLSSCKDNRGEYKKKGKLTQCRNEKENKPTSSIVGSDVMIHNSFDDQSEVTADTALMGDGSKEQQPNDKEASTSILIPMTGTRTKRKEQTLVVDNNDDEYSVNTSHPELPPGWKVRLSRSKNRPYYVHPDHGATWYFPGRSGWKEMYSKTKNRSYFVHPDHGATWFRPMGLTKNIDSSNISKKIDRVFDGTLEEVLVGMKSDVDFENDEQLVSREDNKNPVQPEKQAVQEAKKHVAQGSLGTVESFSNGNEIVEEVIDSHFHAKRVGQSFSSTVENVTSGNDIVQKVIDSLNHSHSSNILIQDVPKSGGEPMYPKASKETSKDVIDPIPLNEPVLYKPSAQDNDIEVVEDNSQFDDDLFHSFDEKPSEEEEEEEKEEQEKTDKIVESFKCSEGVEENNLADKVKQSALNVDDVTHFASGNSNEFEGSIRAKFFSPTVQFDSSSAGGEEDEFEIDNEHPSNSAAMNSCSKNQTESLVSDGIEDQIRQNSQKTNRTILKPSLLPTIANARKNTTIQMTIKEPSSRVKLPWYSICALQRLDQNDR